MRTAFLLYLKLIFFFHSNKIIKKKRFTFPHTQGYSIVQDGFSTRGIIWFLSELVFIAPACGFIAFGGTWHWFLLFMWGCSWCEEKRDLSSMLPYLFPQVYTQTVPSLGQEFSYSLIQVRAFRRLNTLRHPWNYKYSTKLTIWRMATSYTWGEKKAFQLRWKRALNTPYLACKRQCSLRVCLPTLKMPY